MPESENEKSQVQPSSSTPDPAQEASTPHNWQAEYEQRVLAPDQDEEFIGELGTNFKHMHFFRPELFPYDGPHPWLDQADAELRIVDKLEAGEITPDQAEACRFWRDNGYFIIKNCFSKADIDTTWDAYEEAIAQGRVELNQDPKHPDDPYPGRSQDTHLKVREIAAILCNETIKSWISLFMERTAKPFQTLVAHKGSQQATHSDSIHMTTFPLGYLTAAWVAMEDIHEDSGPLVYYPGSHKLPYMLSSDVGITIREFQERQYDAYREKYEPAVRELIDSQALQPKYFLPGKGDVLIWHANLLHGGSLRKNLKYSRKSIVCHYFVEGTFNYHDLSAKRARPHGGTCMIGDHEYSSRRAEH